MPTRGSRPDVGAAPGPQQGRGSGWPAGREAWKGLAGTGRVARRGGWPGGAGGPAGRVAQRGGVLVVRGGRRMGDSGAWRRRSLGG